MFLLNNISNYLCGMNVCRNNKKTIILVALAINDIAAVLRRIKTHCGGHVDIVMRKRNLVR